MLLAVLFLAKATLAIALISATLAPLLRVWTDQADAVPALVVMSGLAPPVLLVALLAVEAAWVLYEFGRVLLVALPRPYRRAILVQDERNAQAT